MVVVFLAVNLDNKRGVPHDYEFVGTYAYESFLGMKARPYCNVVTLIRYGP
jgi:hypothetical protein